MTNEEDKRRIEEARHCFSCLEWLKYCQAECCKLVFVNISLTELNSSREFYVKVPTLLSYGMQKYYELRDVRYKRKTLFFKRNRVTALNGRVTYIHPCKFLKDNKCIMHPDGKPQICKDLNEETARIGLKNVIVTDNCLFRYKNMEVI